MINEEMLQQECNLANRVADLTIQEIRKAIEKNKERLDEWKKAQANKPRKMPMPKQGSMTLKELRAQGGDLSTVELKEPHLRLLKSTLDKHSVDFSAVKDGKGQYTLFFKGKDVDAVTHAFKDYTQKLVKLDKGMGKPAIATALAAAKALAQSLNNGLDKAKTQSRGAR